MRKSCGTNVYSIKEVITIKLVNTNNLYIQQVVIDVVYFYQQVVVFDQ